MYFYRLTDWGKKHKRDLVYMGILLVLAGIPRLLHLGVFLTADEKNWIGRSYEFIRAFKDFRFNDMLQTTHPGVTTLWLVGTAITAKVLLSHTPFSFTHLFYFVKVSQLPIALVTTLTIPTMYLCLRQLFPKRYFVAVVASFFIALDPVLIGYSRVAHVDALLAHFTFLSALLLLIYVQHNFDRKWLIGAAVTSALAVLTKAPAVFLLPYFLLIVGSTKATWSGLSNINKRFKDLIIWLLTIGLLFVIIWPAILWVANPVGNVLLLKRDISEAAVTPHDASEDYSLNASYYLYALLAKTTPITLTLSVICIIWWLLLRRRREQLDTDPRNVWLLMAYIFFFVLMMTIGAKKGDRYILPVWPAIDTLAAIGLVAIAHSISRYATKQTAHTVTGAIVALSLGYLIFINYQYHPYAIAYTNPLFPSNLGGKEPGWGEGLDQVATWLNKNYPNAVVASWYPEELGAFTSAHVAHINAHEQGNIQFVVLYRNMFGRAPDYYSNDFIDEYYKKRVPVFVAHVVGQEYAWVYEKKVYERNTGELLPNISVGQDISPTHNQWMGFDILFATYGGKATTGDVVVTLRETMNETSLQTWKIPVKDLQDNHWQKFDLSSLRDVANKHFFVDIHTEGTTKGNAPTIRDTTLKDYRPGNLYLSNHGLSFSVIDKKPADLAIRLRYLLDNKQEATEDDSKLLK